MFAAQRAFVPQSASSTHATQSRVAVLHTCPEGQSRELVQVWPAAQALLVHTSPVPQSIEVTHSTHTPVETAQCVFPSVRVAQSALEVQP
jgi:hypothetical protein